MNKQEHTKYTIAALISRSVMGDLNADEEAILAKWLQDKKNRELFDRITDAGQIDAKQLFYTGLNKEKAYQKLQKRIELRQRRSLRRKLYSISKYAAVLLVIIAATVTWYNYTLEQERIVTEQTISEIKPGYEKATLILSDGSEIDLETHKDQPIRSTGIARISNVNNTLEYKIPDVVNDKSDIRFNTLYVPIGGIYTVVLPDGSKVWLNSDSSIKYPEVFNGDKRIVELTGEAYFDVVKNKNKEFIVRTQGQDVTVLGTSFNASAYPNDNFFSATLVEGKVKLSSVLSKEVFLNPGDRGVLESGSDKMVKVSKVSTRNYTSWKDGKFYFEHQNLETILKKMGRWYGFKVVFDDETLKKVSFTGVARKDDSLENLLGMISKTARISYKATKDNNGIYEITIIKK